MTAAGDRSSMVEIKHLDERLGGLKKDLTEMRQELRDALAQRVTHAEVGAFMQLADTRLVHMEASITRLSSDHAREMARIEGDYKDRVQALQTAHEKDVAGRKQVVYLLLAAVFAAVGSLIVSLVAG